MAGYFRTNSFSVPRYGFDRSRRATNYSVAPVTRKGEVLLSISEIKWRVDKWRADVKIEKQVKIQIVSDTKYPVATILSIVINACNKVHFRFALYLPANIQRGYLQLSIERMHRSGPSLDQQLFERRDLGFINYRKKQTSDSLSFSSWKHKYVIEGCFRTVTVFVVGSTCPSTATKNFSMDTGFDA